MRIIHTTSVRHARKMTLCDYIKKGNLISSLKYAVSEPYRFFSIVRQRPQDSLFHCLSNSPFLRLPHTARREGSMPLVLGVRHSSHCCLPLLPPSMAGTCCRSLHWCPPCFPPCYFVWLIFPSVHRLEPLKLVKTGLAFLLVLIVRRSSQVVIYPSSPLGLVSAVVLVSCFPPCYFVWLST